MTAHDPVALEDCHCKKKQELQALVCKLFVIFDKGIDELQQSTKAARVLLESKPELKPPPVASRRANFRTEENNSDDNDLVSSDWNKKVA